MKCTHFQVSLAQCLKVKKKLDVFDLCQAGADRACVLYGRTVQLDVLYKKELLKKSQTGGGEIEA